MMELQLHMSRVRIYEASGRAWPIGCSVGSVTFTRAPDTVDDMVHRSDQLMYDIERSGKNAIRAVVAA